MTRQLLFSCNLERELQEEKDKEINNALCTEILERIFNNLIDKTDQRIKLLVHKKSEKNTIIKTMRVFEDILNVSIF